MPSAYTQNLYHAVFSTKHRAMLITPDLEERLYPFMGGILRDLHCALLAVNGMPDDVPEVGAYIARQRGHHRYMDFKTEFLELLRRHDVEFIADEVFE